MAHTEVDNLRAILAVRSACGVGRTRRLFADSRDLVALCQAHRPTPRFGRAARCSGLSCQNTATFCSERTDLAWLACFSFFLSQGVGISPDGKSLVSTCFCPARLPPAYTPQHEMQQKISRAQRPHARI